MSLQLVAVAVIVGLAALYVARSAWRTWAGRKMGCSAGCGKCATEPRRPDTNGRISLPQV